MIVARMLFNVLLLYRQLREPLFFYFLANQEIHFENEEWRTLLGE